MNYERFNPFIENITSKFNLLMVLFGVIFLIDLYHGSFITRQIILLQCKVMNIDPSIKNFQILTIFGKFSSVDNLAKVIDKALVIVFFILSGGSYFFGFLASVFNK